MCRFTCCGCYLRYAHRVVGFKKDGQNINVDISNSDNISNGFLCIQFKGVPSGLSSYPIKVNINGENVSVKKRSGEKVMTSDLHECVLLSGIYTNGDCPEYIVTFCN